MTPQPSTPETPVQVAEEAPSKAYLPTVPDMLDILASLHNDLENNTREKEAEIAAAIPEDVKNEIKAITDSHDARSVEINAAINKIETLIRELTLSLGETQKGRAWMAVYSKGKVSWDANKLEGYAVAHPDVLALRTEGKPSISLRRL